MKVNHEHYHYREHHSSPYPRGYYGTGQQATGEANTAIANALTDAGKGRENNIRTFSGGERLQDTLQRMEVLTGSGTAP